MRRSFEAIGRIVIGHAESSVVRERLVRGAGGLFALRVAFSGISFLVTILLARLLGQSGYGFYAYSFSWIVLIGVPAILGMDQILVRDIAAYHAKSEWGRMCSLLYKATWAVLVVSTGLATCAGFGAWFLLRGDPAPMLSTFWMALFLVPVIALTRVRQAAMQGLHRVALGVLPEQLIQPASLLVFLLMAYLRGYRLTPPAAMGLTDASALSGLVVGFALLIRTVPQTATRARSVHYKLDFGRSVLPVVLITGVSVVFGQADTLILGALKGAAAVGIYSVAHKGAEFVSYPLVVQNAAFASTIASFYALGQKARLQRLVTRLARWTLLASVPIASFLVLFGGWFLDLYGPSFRGARLTLAILSIGQFFDVALGSVGILLIMTGYERDAAISIGAGALVNIALTFALVPRWGSEGAAIAYGIGMMLWNLLAAIALRRRAAIDSTAIGSFVFTP